MQPHMISGRITWQVREGMTQVLAGGSVTPL